MVEHTLVITRDEAGLARLRQHRPTTDRDTADFHLARIECSDPAACEAWVECREDGHGDPEDYDYEPTVFHGVEHEYLDAVGYWCVPSPHCAASLCEWYIPDEIDTTTDGTYPVSVDWDDEWLIVRLIKPDSDRTCIVLGCTRTAPDPGTVCDRHLYQQSPSLREAWTLDDAYRQAFWDSYDEATGRREWA